MRDESASKPYYIAIEYLILVGNAAVSSGIAEVERFVVVVARFL